MSLGRFQHRLTIQSRTRGSDGGGGASTTWADVDTVWGQIEGTGGNERLYGDQIEARTTHRITIRFRRDVAAKNRILYSYAVDGTNYTRTFNINTVINVGERDKYLELRCSEGVAT